MLIEGRPGAGKTTCIRRLLDLLRGAGIAVAGFTTEELRDSGRRVGFAIEDTSGRREVMAHITRRGPVRVGKYGVDVAALERIALPALGEASPETVLVIDELGKMELASAALVKAVLAEFERDRPVIATVHSFKHPVTDELKSRADVEIVLLTPTNRDALPSELAGRFQSRSSTR